MNDQNTRSSVAHKAMVVGSTVAGLSLVAIPAFAQTVDPTPAAISGTFIDSLKTNTFAVLTTNLPTLSLVAAAFLGIAFIWRMFRRFAK